MVGRSELELLLRLDAETRNRIQEHFGEVVRCLDLRAMDQTQEQGVPLGRGDVLEFGGVEHLSFRDKMADLGRCQTGQKLALVAKDFEPAQVTHEFVEM